MYLYSSFTIILLLLLYREVVCYYIYQSLFYGFDRNNNVILFAQYAGCSTVYIANTILLTTDVLYYLSETI